MSWVDSILDTAARAGSVVVFVAGAIPALASVTVLGASIGAIGYYAESFALYGGLATVTMSGVQVISGITGYRLDGKN